MDSATAVRAIIADDEPHLARYLQERLALVWPQLQVVAVARNGIEASELVAAHAPDVVFLDIKMPGRSGIEVAQGIETATQVVFVTAYDDFAVQAFEREAVDYLLKPVGDERLTQCVRRVRRRLSGHANFGMPHAASETMPELGPLLNRLLGHSPGDGSASTAPVRALRWIRASRGDTTFQIPVGEVLFFEADDKYTCVFVEGAEHLIRMPIAELARSLDPEQFWQVHRALIINVSAVLSTRRDENGRLFVRLKGVARELAVSRAYTHLFRTM
jgi:DNA-binding LytR/AlgR family response regulator